MCGIFGWSLSDQVSNESRRALAYVLGVAMNDRGGQSCGWVYRDRPGEFGDPGPWRRTRHVGSVLPHIRDLARHSTVAVHTRYATHGAVIKANAHPFAMPGATGYLAHNGVVHAIDAANEPTHQVDSEMLARRVGKGLPLDDLYGYGTVWFVRNGETDVKVSRISDRGDLCVADVERRGESIGCVWASTPMAVREACQAARLRFSVYTARHGEVLSARPSGMYIADHDPLKLSDYLPVVIDPRTRGIAAGEPRASVTPITHHTQIKRTPTQGTDDPLGDSRTWPEWLRKFGEIKS